jgi:hypothetical protein
MMNDNSKRILIGGLLVLAGVVFILQQLFSWPIGGVFISMLFAGGAIVFLYVFLRDHNKWWALIPGFTLLGLALVIATSDLFPRFNSQFGGTIFLGSIALAFILIFVFRRDFWWAIIPGGVLTTLALMTAIPAENGLFTGGLFFLGIGATFGLLGLLPVGKKEKWPWIPAAICVVLGTLILIGSGALVDTIFGWIWAGAFLVAGIFLVARALIKKE